MESADGVPNEKRAQPVARANGPKRPWLILNVRQNKASPMNTADQTFKLQTQLSTWSGTKMIAGWLVIVAFALSGVGIILAFVGEVRGLGALSGPLFLAAMCTMVRSQATRKIAEIQALLSS